MWLLHMSACPRPFHASTHAPRAGPPPPASCSAVAEPSSRQRPIEGDCPICYEEMTAGSRWGTGGRCILHGGQLQDATMATAGRLQRPSQGGCNGIQDAAVARAYWGDALATVHGYTCTL